MTLDEEESNHNSSNLESSEFEEKTNNISLDISSNKINPLNRYTFNTKFCDFNNNNKQNNNRECFEDVELFEDRNYI